MSLISRDYLTSEELASLKGVTLKTVYKWIEKGKAPLHERFGGRIWFNRQQAMEFVVPTRGRKPK